jgi:DNA-binding transcriptional regulator LsrR (DeoR family)
MDAYAFFGYMESAGQDALKCVDCGGDACGEYIDDEGYVCETCIHGEEVSDDL